MRIRAMLLPWLAIALLAGCSSNPATSPVASGPPQSPSSRPSAAGLFFPSGVYISVSAQGHDLVAGTKVTLTFKDGQITANAGCNTLGGQAAVVGDGVLQVNSMASTEMGCAADLMAQDAWLVAFLPGAKADVTPESIVLSKGAETLSLAARQTTSLPLEGTIWTVDGLITGDAVASPPQGVAVTLVIDTGRAHVFTGCNWGVIPVTIADGTVAFGPVGMTARGCAGDVGSVEQVVLAVIDGAQPYLIYGDSLTIGTPGKAAIMFKGSAPKPSGGPS